MTKEKVDSKLIAHQLLVELLVYGTLFPFPSEILGKG